MEVHLVVATNERQSRFWAVAAPPKEAIELVGQLAAPGSTITPTDRTLTPDMLAALKQARPCAGITVRAAQRNLSEARLSLAAFVGSTGMMKKKSRRPQPEAASTLACRAEPRERRRFPNSDDHGCPRAWRR